MSLFDQSGFWFLRHGETVANAAGVIAGALDTPLTALGRQQAAQAADHLVGQGIAAIWASPLVRARDTAQAVADRLGLPVQLLDDLAERRWGAWEGLDRSVLVRSATPPGGEGPQEFADRVWRGLQAIAPPHPVLIVAHSGVARVLRARLLGGDEVGQVGNAIPLRFLRQGQEWRWTGLG